MLTFNAKNRIADESNLYLSVEEDPLPIDFDLSLSFARFKNTLNYANTEYIAVDSLLNTVSHEFPAQIPTDHHDFRTRLLPDTYDYLSENVLPDGVKLNQEAHDRWAITTELDQEMQTLYDVAKNQYNIMEERLDAYVHDAAEIARVKRDYAERMQKLGELSRGKVWRYRDLPVLLLKVIIQIAGTKYTLLPAMRLVYSIIQRVISQFFNGRDMEIPEAARDPNVAIPPQLIQELINMALRVYLQAMTPVSSK